MKKVLLGLLAVVAMVLPASAQKATVYATYGAYTSNDAIDAYHDDWDIHTAWGSVNAGVDFNFGKFHFGPSYSFSSASTPGGKGASHAYYHSILLNGKMDYYRTGILTLYAHVGLGATISHMAPKRGGSYDEGHFAFQVSPVAARVALGSGFNFIGELGFGAQGVAQFGFSYDF